MTSTEHEKYAKELLSSLSDGDQEIDGLNFAPASSGRRNAAKAVAAILCHRLLTNTGHDPTRKANATYEWREGIFNCRNIADRGYMWTNMRRNLANKIHETARRKPAAYLLASWNPPETTLNVWAIPEPLLNDSLSSLPFEEKGRKYTVQIRPDKQRIERYDASPDLTRYFRRFRLARQELLVLQEAREADASAKAERETARGEEESHTDDGEQGSDGESDTGQLLAGAAQRLTEAGVFDPEGIADARERILSSIVRRRGRPAFRQRLLAAYDGRCAITGCDVEAVLEAAHIVPYRGPKTDHPGNGLLLRTDLHTLFDLKLVAVDVATMSLLVSPSLAGTCYAGYHGRPISAPGGPGSRPSRKALERHRRESGL
jgi:hypothetical protein